MRSFALAIAACALVGGCTGSPGSAPAPRWRTVSLTASVTVRVPAVWTTARYRGAPAPVYFPLVYASTTRLPSGCDVASAHCDAGNWFPATWRTPDDGVLALWSHAEIPGDGATWPVALPGSAAVVAGRSARIRYGAATTGCPPGTDRELDAYVRESQSTGPGNRLDLKACFGPNADTGDRSSVRMMLAGLRISG